ncbi:hypothetical protein HJC23_004193 [Cyclotella cryptica]|uniref:Uncharacterized protein n=1 Tax=Cyclotella cryptica TaxID=29204 RepID=A0ABD3Q9I3_9STRA
MVVTLSEPDRKLTSPLALNRPTHHRCVPLYANNQDLEPANNDVRSSSSRRHAALQISAAAAAVVARSYPSDANADDAETRKFIEFTVNNLDGDEGSTGTLVIKTHPEWAPIGVERFEVCLSAILHDFSVAFCVVPLKFLAFIVCCVFPHRH